MSILDIFGKVQGHFFGAAGARPLPTTSEQEAIKQQLSTADLIQKIREKYAAQQLENDYLRYWLAQACDIARTHDGDERECAIVELASEYSRNHPAKPMWGSLAFEAMLKDAATRLERND